MALTDEGSMGTTMLVQPSGIAGNGMGGLFGGDLSIIILFFLFMMLGGWGGMGGMGGFDGLYPWMNNSQNINDGFRDQMLNTSITSLGDKLNGISTQLCNGFNQNQISSMQTAFGLQSQLSQCCCDNKAGLADLKYKIATENCADRAVVSDGIRDLITANNASTQRILDQLCADKIEAKNDIIAQLRSELLYARGQASQDVQTAAIQAGQRALANEIEQYVLPTPRPAYIVSNPNCCQTTCGCGV